MVDNLDSKHNTNIVGSLNSKMVYKKSSGTQYSSFLNSIPKGDAEILSEFIDAGKISHDECLIVGEVYNRNTDDVISLFVDYGFIKAEDVQSAMYAKNIGTVVSLSKYVPDPSLAKLVNKAIAIANKFVLLKLDNGKDLTIAFSDFKSKQPLAMVRNLLGKNYNIIPVFAKASEINIFIEKTYSKDVNILETAIKNLREASMYKTIDGKNQIGSIIINFTNALLEDATLRNASDIHLNIFENFIRVRYRIDGVLFKVAHINKEFWSNILIRIKVFTGMNIAETRRPQDGHIEMNIMNRRVDFRVAMQPTVHGENVIIRILDKKQSLVTLDNLGFSEVNYLRAKYAIEKPHGILIVTGPTGSGKTTTLYSALAHLNDEKVNIMTLEDPVEYTIPMIVQSQVNEQANFTFESGIRSAMRQDPDILLIGEIRDFNTAQTAIRASLTGHKVLSTLHTIDAASAIQRLLDIGIQSYMLSGNLTAIVAQRLIRKLCVHCKEPHTLTEKEKNIVGLYDLIRPLFNGEPTFCKPNGCPACFNTGFHGRTAITEVLNITPEIDEMILRGDTKYNIVRLAREKAGFITMQDDAMLRILAGELSLAETAKEIALF